MEADLASLFLGPKGENADVFERLLLEAVRDHVFWRRNFHPEDGFLVSEQDRRAPAYQEGLANLSQELLALLGELKDAVPFHSPRYIGHMSADVTMASMVGYFAAMLYNPNNVTTEASPVTTRLELAVGKELAELVGYPGATQWSHLTSGGTVANFEALWIARSVKYLPVALRWASRALGLDVRLDLPDGTAADARDLPLWRLLNVSPQATLDAADRFVAAAGDPRVAHRALADWSLAGLGYQEFGRKLAEEFGDSLAPGVVLVPSTAHYSWEKLCRSLGIGASQLVKLPVDAQFRTDVNALREVCEKLAAKHQPIIACVTVAGTTEEGAVDRVDQIANLRARLGLEQGISFHLHADAAYGGYAAAITRGRDGQRRTFAAARADYAPEEWPTREVFDGLVGLERTDSITIDPHKLGFVPYPAGAISFRDGRVKDLVSADAPYTFGDDRPAADLGRYVFEGSKPGAAAAAVWLGHRVLPLNAGGYGRLIGETARGAARLHRVLERHDFGPFQRVLLPPSDLNIVCFAFSHHTLRTLEENNAFIERVHRAMSAGGRKPARSLDYFVSRTMLKATEYGAAAEGFATQLGFTAEDYRRAGGVTVLRCTVMDPLLSTKRGKVDFLEGFVTTLSTVLGECLRPVGLRAAPANVVVNSAERVFGANDPVK